MDAPTYADMASGQPTLAQCCVCLDEHPSKATFTVPDHLICHKCLLQLFQRALDNEADYPPKLGPHTLEPRIGYPRSILKPQFLQAYREKEREYRCPLARRLFCSWPKLSALNQTNDFCNNFLGQKVEKPSEVLAHGSQLVAKCPKCNEFSCRACGDHIEDSDFARDHKCISLSAADAESEAFSGLKRGKDFQICPSERCGRRVELSSGCNHIVCYCKQQFCFLCGEPAGADSRHWERRADGTAACPRYNQPGAPNAMFDRGNAQPVRMDHILQRIIPAHEVLAADAVEDWNFGEPHQLPAFPDDILNPLPIHQAQPAPLLHRRGVAQRRRPRRELDRGQQSFADEPPNQDEDEPVTRSRVRTLSRTLAEELMLARQMQRLRQDERFAEQRRLWDDMAARRMVEATRRDADHEAPTIAAALTNNNILAGAHNNSDDMFQFDNFLDRRHARVFPDPTPPAGFYDDNGAYDHPHPLQSSPLTGLDLLNSGGFMTNNPAVNAFQSTAEQYRQWREMMNREIINNQTLQQAKRPEEFNSLHTHHHHASRSLDGATEVDSQPAPTHTTQTFPNLHVDPTDFNSDAMPNTMMKRFGAGAMRSILRGAQSTFGFGTQAHHPHLSLTTANKENTLTADRRGPLTSHRTPHVPPGFPAQTTPSAMLDTKSARPNAIPSLTPTNTATRRRQAVSDFEAASSRIRRALPRRFHMAPQRTRAGAPSPESRHRVPHQTGSDEDVAFSEDLRYPWEDASGNTRFM